MIINGVLKKELYEKTENYAFLEGMQTCRLEEPVSDNKYKGKGFLCMDLKGMEQTRRESLEILLVHYPVIVAAESDEEKKEIQEKYGSLCNRVLYPFTYREFHRTIKKYSAQAMMEKQRLHYGRLEINKDNREVRIDGQIVEMGAFEYEVLLILIGHMGEIVSREEINYCLPRRRRTTLRNVDTHIKNIRKVLGKNEIIKCVRNVGYGICVEEFYQVLKEA